MVCRWCKITVTQNRKSGNYETIIGGQFCTAYGAKHPHLPVEVTR